jgi:hypothetical protein
MASSQSVRVFETIAQSEGGVDVLTEQAVSNLESAGYTVLGVRPSGMDGACTGEAQVVSAVKLDALNPLFDLNERTAPYGLVDRIAVFRDETGVYLSTIHPGSLLRTVFMDNDGVEDVAAERRTVLREALGATMAREYGQNRQKGHIGKTMGVIAGGPFDEKIGVVGSAEGISVKEAADRIMAGFGESDMEWGMEIAYRLDLEDRGIAILGVTSVEMEARSFAIVGAGSDKERKNIACAGSAYAAAYPIELVVSEQDGRVVIESVDAMYRMKLFFEDAAKWAFMKNMTMPGSLASEIKGRLESALANAEM